MREKAQTLIIDADDTLWENNVHFEDATERFLDLIVERGGDRVRARKRLVEVERRNVPIHGYGSRGFARSLLDTLEETIGGAASASDRERILALGRNVRDMPIRFLPGVEQTLVVLRQRYSLILFTKGDPPEQQAKVERSGAGRLFHHVEITTEKTPLDYQRLILDYRLARERTWMVGNSPRSDINPALEAGLGAIYIPHPSTWVLEHEDVRESDSRLVILERFSELLDLTL